VNVNGDCRVVYYRSNFQIISFMIGDEKVNLDMGKTRE